MKHVPAKLNELADSCDSSKTGLAIFSYIRPNHVGQLYQKLIFLKISDKYCFHLFNDGPKESETLDIRAVRSLTESFTENVTNFVVTQRVENLGLSRSIRLGMNSVFTNHTKAIVLEDDIIPTGAFFETMDHFLQTHQDKSVIGSITGANSTKFPPFERRDFLASRRHSSWGWATWADRWTTINWDLVEESFFKDEEWIQKAKRVSPDLVRYAQLQESGKIDSWATYMNLDFIKRDLLCIVPRRNLVSNIGFDGSGTHNTNAKHLQNPKFSPPKKISQMKFHNEIDESALYNLKVRVDRSLLRDFPKGTVIRLLIKIRDAFFIPKNS